MKVLGRIGNSLAVFWIAWVVLVYFLFQPGSIQSVIEVPYKAPLLLLGLACIAGHFLIYRAGKVIQWRGFYWFAGVMIFSFIIIPSFYGSTGFESQNLGGQLMFYLAFSSLLVAFLVALFGSAWSLGSFVWRYLLRLSPIENQGFVNLALGISTQTVIITFLALVGLYNTFSVGALFLLSFAVSYNQIIPFYQRLIWSKKAVRLEKSWEIPLYIALFGTLTIAWVSGIKPFPQGNDGASLYLSLSHMLADSWSLPKGGQSYAWSIYMSVGELIGQSEVFTVLLSHSMGFLCLAALYYLLKNWFGSSYAILAALLVFISPYFAFHSIIDEKVDLALLFFSIVITQLTFHFFFSDNNTIDKRKAIIAMGWLCGFAFSVKYSFMLVLIPVIAFTVSKSLRFASALFLIMIGLLYAVGASRYIGLDMSQVERIITVIGFLAMGLAIAWKSGGLVNHFKSALINGSIFLVIVLLPFSPWMVKNLQENESFSLNHLLEGQQEAPILLTKPELFGYNTSKQYNQRPLNSLRPELMALEEDKPQKPKASQSRYEELQRYLGFEDGIWRYLSLPLDLTLSINIVGNRYVKIGFMFLGLLPLFLYRKNHLVRNVILGSLTFLWVSMSLLSINYYTDESKNADNILLIQDLLERQPDGYKSIAEATSSALVHPLFSTGKALESFYGIGEGLSQPWSALILGIIFFIVGYFSRPTVRRWDARNRSLLVYIMMLMLAWWLLGMGVVWYGMLFFALFPSLLVVVLAHKKEQNSWLGSSLIQNGILFILLFQVLVHTMMYFTNPRVGGRADVLFSWPNLAYASQPDFSKHDVMGAYNPQYNEVIDKLNQDKSAKIYMVNSTLEYHVENKEERVFEDNLLTWYQGEKAKYGERLQYDLALSESNFEYILFNLNTPTLDKTPEQRLAERCREFVRLIVNSELYEIDVTDNYVYDANANRIKLPGGQVTTARQGIMGQIVHSGSFILFKKK